MISPAKAHLERVEAGQAAKSPDDMSNHSVYQLKLAEMHNNLRQLKRVQSRETRTGMKAAILPEYQAYVEGVLAEGEGADDAVLMQVFIWQLDVGDLAAFMQIAEYAIEHGLSLPERFKRTLPCFVVEETSLSVIAKLPNDHPADDLVLLNQVAALTPEADMPDEVRAKQAKAFGLVLATDPATQVEAIAHLERALQLDASITHVKTPLQQLKKANPEHATDAIGAT